MKYLVDFESIQSQKVLIFFKTKYRPFVPQGQILQNFNIDKLHTATETQLHLKPEDYRKLQLR